MLDDFFRSYLSNRSQFVFLNNVRSQEHELVCGAPQGSVLVPILFNIDVNDIVHVSDKFKFVLLTIPIYYTRVGTMSL